MAAPRLMHGGRGGRPGPPAARGGGRHLPLGHLAPVLAERFDAPIDFGGPRGHRVSLPERGFA
ncbi:hypothetical protein ACFTZF_44020 [Streptomyces mirabilis]|uniref:hypothetical protein n=1 Tax=Streptomyces mirabilis TaxID=68239 RepID=UPI003626CFFF